MANPYDSQSASNYNASPPPDDGSETTANLVTWAGIKTKLVDPVKALADAINTAVSTAFGKIWFNATNSQSATYSLQSTDQGKVIKCTNSITINLLAAATAGDGFAFAVSNVGTGTITIDPDGSELINGGSTYLLSGQYDSAQLICDGTGWTVVGTSAIRTEPATAKTSNFTAAATDRGKLFVVSTSVTVSLTAAATLGNGWWCDIRNDGTNDVTIDPNASETIDGATTLTLSPQQACRVVCDGTNFKTVGLAAPATRAQMEAATATGAFLTPANAQWHPSATKVWGYVTFSAGAPTLQANQNVTSITDSGTGITDVTIATDFSSANYSAVPGYNKDDNGHARLHNLAAGSFRVKTFTNDATAVAQADSDFSFAAFGDQ